MSETLLESIRRQMRKAEERLKKTGESGPPDPSVSLEGNSQTSVSASRLPSRSGEDPHPMPLSEWIAYGQMTPGFLMELSTLISDRLRGASEIVRVQAKPELTKLMQEMDRVRSLLEGWAESALFLPAAMGEGTFPEMVQNALKARKAELARWKIKTEFEDATTGIALHAYSPALFRAILHVTQFCVEQLRERLGESRLLVRIQISGERVETIFLCDSSGAASPVQGSFPYESLRSKNVELRAAQKLLDSIGGALVLENVNEAQRAVRIHLGGSVVSIDKDRSEKSRI